MTLNIIDDKDIVATLFEYLYFQNIIEFNCNLEQRRIAAP